MPASTLDPASWDLRFDYKTITFFGWPSQTILLRYPSHIAVLTPKLFLTQVWPLSLSLATTHKISVDFFSSAYLDVSVRRVPSHTLCIHVWVILCMRFPHSEIHGRNGYLLLTVAYRSLSRPSSAPDAKAFALCSYSLELSSMN